MALIGAETIFICSVTVWLVGLLSGERSSDTYLAISFFFPSGMPWVFVLTVCNFELLSKIYGKFMQGRSQDNVQTR